MPTYPHRSPLKAIRAFCVECQGDSFQAVAECRDLACPFYAYRNGTPPDGQPHKPLVAIKTYCSIYCLPDGGRDAVLTCQGDKAYAGPCPVFPFRLGVNPNISAETREKARQAALKRAVKGQFGFSKSTVHVPSEAPESTEMGRAIL